MIRTTRSTTRALAFVATLGALVLGVAAPAQAGTGDIHCIVFADDGTGVCAETLEAADAAFTAATGYTRDVDARGEAVTRGGIVPLAVYSLATFYQNTLYGGSSLTITRSTPCNGSTQSGFSDLSAYGMNNSISSFITYGSCQARLYDGTGYTGGTFGYTTTQASLPLFNDLASSVRAR